VAFSEDEIKNCKEIADKFVNYNVSLCEANNNIGYQEMYLLNFDRSIKETVLAITSIHNFKLHGKSTIQSGRY
jgi:hypothetical protein